MARVLVLILVLSRFAFAQPALEIPGQLQELTGFSWWSDYRGLSDVARMYFGQGCIAETTHSFWLSYGGTSLSLLLLGQLQNQGYRAWRLHTERGYLEVYRIVGVTPHRVILEVIISGRLTKFRLCEVYEPA